MAIFITLVFFTSKCVYPLQNSAALAALNKKGRGCSKQCSDYCNIMLRESDFHCNYQCNVSACDYDNARCLV